MDIKIRMADAALDEAAIAAAETRMARKIPPAYRSFLLAYNAAIPERTEYVARLPDGTAAVFSVAFFLGITDSHSITIESCVHEYSGRMPPELFPIAIDPGGNIIAVSTSGDACDAIFFWDHEFEPEPEEQPSYANIYAIAPSFSAFLELLY